MSFALLLSHLPHVEESRVYYDTVLSLQPVPHPLLHRLALFCRSLRSHF